MVHLLQPSNRLPNIVVIEHEQEGQTFKAAVLGEGRFTATIRQQDNAGTLIELEDTPSTSTPSAVHIRLLLACPRPKVLRRLMFHLTSLGVSSIIITKAEKVESPFFSSSLVSPPVLAREILRGLEQVSTYEPPELYISSRSLQSSLRTLDQLQSGAAIEKLPWGVTK